MMRLLIAVIFLSVLSPSWAQYTYFNETAGVVQDTLAELFTNVELHGDTILVFGTKGIDGIENFIHFRKYAANGVQLQVIEYPYATQTVFVENTGSFKKLSDTNRFIVTCGAVSDYSRGYAVSLNAQLDTLWTKQYDIYPTFTYFKRNIDVSDGIVIAGEWDSDGTQRGTMLAKIDYQGNLLWNQVLQPSGGHIIGNFDILEHEGYLVVGGSRNLTTQAENEGTITKCAWDGTPIWEYIDDDIDLGTLPYYLCETTNDRLLAATSVRYDQAGASPISYFMKIRVKEVDIINEEFTWEQEYFFNEEMDNAYVNKILATNDGGALILGTDITDYLDAQNEFKAFLLKIDSLGNEEWFNYYAYEYGNDHMSTAYDVEQTSDGGYVIAGDYSNWNVSNSLPRGWLLKVDACGDLEWQGCAGPNGIQDWEIQDSRLEIFPNPVSGDEINIRFPREEEVERVQIIDGQGSEVCLRLESLRFEVSAHSETNFKLQTKELQTLPPGLYSLLITTRDGDVYSGKVLIE